MRLTNVYPGRTNVDIRLCQMPRSSELELDECILIEVGGDSAHQYNYWITKDSFDAFIRAYIDVRGYPIKDEGEDDGR